MADCTFSAIDRLIDTLKASRQKKAQDIGGAIVRGVKEFSGLARQADDVTIVVIKIVG